MLSFAFERRYHVLLSRFSGNLTDADLLEQVRVAKAVSARQTVAASIADFTDVETIEVSTGLVTSLARLTNPKSRVFVVPKPEMFGLARLYSTHNAFASVNPPILTKTLDEAFRCLLLQTPDFQPLEPPALGDSN